MSNKLQTDPALVQEYPYAVGVETNTGWEFFHFTRKDTAELYASLWDGPVKRYVALIDGSDWREVSYFVL